MAERDWIRRYFAPLARSPGADGLTDDTAQLSSAAGAVVITTDAMVEGVHFLADDPIDTVARKLVRVNVSDILSNGAEPVEALLTLGWPAERPEADLAAFASALGAELAEWNISLIGGDTVSTLGGLFLSLVLTGRCLGSGPVRRGGAQPGDAVWVTGEIGGARRGFLSRAAGEDSPWTGTLRQPDLPPSGIAALVAAHATAAMDISDGLLGDVLVLAEASGIAADIRLDAVPFAGGASNLAEALDLATWGDDYQILLTAPPEASEGLLQDAGKYGIRITRIGRMAGGQGLTLSDQNGAVNLPETLRFEHGRIGMSGTRP